MCAATPQESLPLSAPSQSKTGIKTLLQRQNRLHLRTVLVVPFIVPIVISTGLVGWFSYRNGQESVGRLAAKVRVEVAARTQEGLKRYFEIPHQITRSNINALRLEEIDLKQPEKLEQHFFHQLQLFPSASNLYVGLPDGSITLVQRRLDNSLVANTTAQVPRREQYSLDPSTGKRLQLLNVTTYDARTRPWYKIALEKRGPTWTEVYQFVTLKTLGITATEPYYDPQGNLIAIFTTDLPLRGISDFLQTIKVSERGQILILDRKGFLVGSSSGEEPVTLKAENQQEQLAASASRHELTRKTAKYLQGRFKDFGAIQGFQELSFDDSGERFYLLIKPFQDGKGLDFLITVVVPESDFMGQIQANNRITLVLCLLTLIVATSVGVITARWLNNQILKLNHAAGDIAAGNLSQQLEVSGIVEIERLARSFNNMAGQLERSFTDLQHSEATNRAIISAIPDLLIRATKDGIYLDITGHDRFAVHATQYLLSGSSVYDSLPPELAEKRMFHIQQALETGEVQIYEQQIQVEGKLQDEEVRIVVVEDDTVLIIVRDITKRKQAEAALKQLKDSFARFFPPEYLEFLGKDSVLNIQLGDHISRDMAVMFSDIRSFTTLSETMTPQESIGFVNDYLQWVSPVIRHHNGFVVKFLGDGIMAVFPGGADDVLEAGINKFQQLQYYNQLRQSKGEFPIDIGMGLHIGPMMVGMVGEYNRIQPDALSDTINLTARLEGLTKFYGSRLLITGDILQQLSNPTQHQFRFLDRVIVKGRSESVSIFEVLDVEPEAVLQQKLQTLSEFEQALSYYTAGLLSEAYDLFQQIHQQSPLDIAVQMYLERISQLIKIGLPENWTGVWVFKQK